MKTIEERAKEYASKKADIYLSPVYNDALTNLYKEGYIAGATEQKAIDDAELLKLKSAWEKEAQINHDDEANYKQGYHDAIDKACNIFCHTGCPHKTDSYNCLNNKCDTWKIFRKAMEE